MTHRLGIMQGRLTPVEDGRIQAYPADNWQAELKLASTLGFDLLEWVVDSDSLGTNALLSSDGRVEIREAAAAAGMEIPLVCVDVFMDYPLTAGDVAERQRAVGLLDDLIAHAGETGVRQIEIPLIGASGIEDAEVQTRLVGQVAGLAPRLRESGVQLFFEVSLGPDAAGDFIERLPSDCFSLNYDTGNSAYWAFDAVREIDRYGTRIGNVHIKDCTPADYSVPLGEGNVDFGRTFSDLAGLNYRGDFILQTVRADNDVQAATEFAAFTRGFIDTYLRSGQQDPR